jgi:hypothetical protein
MGLIPSVKEEMTRALTIATFPNVGHHYAELLFHEVLFRPIT